MQWGLSPHEIVRPDPKFKHANKVLDAGIAEGPFSIILSLIQSLQGYNYQILLQIPSLIWIACSLIELCIWMHALISEFAWAINE